MKEWEGNSYLRCFVLNAGGLLELDLMPGRVLHFKKGGFWGVGL